VQSARPLAFAQPVRFAKSDTRTTSPIRAGRIALASEPAP
jgi:hypothetical protein